MARNITVGIDIGSWETKVVVSEISISEEGKEIPKIIAIGKSESRGLRHGYVVNNKEASKSVELAIRNAEKSLQLPIKKVFISVGGIGIQSVSAVGSVVISRADSEITNLDMDKATASAQSSLPESAILNKRIIHAIPLSYKIDGKTALGNPIGMKGMKLEVKVLFVTCLEHHLNDIIQAVEEAGLEVIDVTPAPFATAHVMLTKAQRIAGCVLCNIGSETTSIVVYENNVPISLEVFEIGSNDITNDIALGLRIPLEEAEQVKLGSVVGGNYPKKKLDEIIAARLSDIFDLVESHLKKIGKSGLLPAGIILTGGGACFPLIEEFARGYLKLPAKVGVLSQHFGKQELKDSSWSVAFGLCVYGFSSDNAGTVHVSSIGIKKSLGKLGDWFKQFLP